MLSDVHRYMAQMRNSMQVVTVHVIVFDTDVALFKMSSYDDAGMVPVINYMTNRTAGQRNGTRTDLMLMIANVLAHDIWTGSVQINANAYSAGAYSVGAASTNISADANVVAARMIERYHTCLQPVESKHESVVTVVLTDGCPIIPGETYERACVLVERALVESTLGMTDDTDRATIWIQYGDTEYGDTATTRFLKRMDSGLVDAIRRTHQVRVYDAVDYGQREVDWATKVGKNVALARHLGVMPREWWAYDIALIITIAFCD